MERIAITITNLSGPVLKEVGALFIWLYILTFFEEQILSNVEISIVFVFMYRSLFRREMWS